MGFLDNFPGILTKAMSQTGGGSATFTDVGGEATPCTAKVNYDVLIQAEGCDVGVATVGTTIEAMVVEVGTPRKGAVFEVDPDTWKVQRMEANDGMMITLVVKKA